MLGITVLLTLISCAVAMPQFGGGSAGGLLGHHQPLDHYIIGLSGGIEESHGHHEDEHHHHEDEHHHHEDEHHHHEDEDHHQEEHHDHQEEHKEHSLGFTGSNFETPVDVHHEEEVHIKAKPEYHYDYHVADHKHKDYKSKHEVRDGYKVKGTYSLLEPDHKTIRIVDYESDKKQGFIAKVSYKKHI